MTYVSLHPPGTGLVNFVEEKVREFRGPGRRVLGLIRLQGGTKKGVYRVLLDDRSTLVAYVWDASHNQWLALGDDQSNSGDPLTNATGLALFLSAHRALENLAVRVPAIYGADNSQRAYPADIALVEDIDGLPLETHLAEDRHAPGRVLPLLAESVNRMHGVSSPVLGRVQLVEEGRGPTLGSCHRYVLSRALQDLDAAAARDSRVHVARAKLAARLAALTEGIEPRTSYSLIHGELGPDHVLIDHDGRPTLIDIESLMYFDLEWEHAFLRIRFGQHYPALDPGGLDLPRMDLYTLATRLSLVAGPLHLLENGCANPDFMRHIAEHNLAETLVLCS